MKLDRFQALRIACLILGSSLAHSAPQGTDLPPLPPLPALPDLPALPSLSRGSPALSQDQLVRGLKEALGNGLDHAVASLGREQGFLTNLNVRIPIPPKLQTVEKTLRSLGQQRVADHFVETMNHAAEQAVPAAAVVFKDTLQKMTVADARRILSGSSNAATLYFRENTHAELTRKFLPIVQKATEGAGTTAAYKQVSDKLRLAGPFVRMPNMDLDAYVTEKALDGLFTLVAEEEQRIRENPAARTTDLLKSVFGSLRK